MANSVVLSAMLLTTLLILLSASRCRGGGAELSAKFEACQLRECSRWAEWGAWSKCECSAGMKTRSRWVREFVRPVAKR